MSLKRLKKHFVSVYPKRCTSDFAWTINTGSRVLTKAGNNSLKSLESGKGGSSVQNEFPKWEGQAVRKSEAAYKWSRELHQGHAVVPLAHARSLERAPIGAAIASCCFPLIHQSLLERIFLNFFSSANDILPRSDRLRSELFPCNSVLSL